MAAVYYYSGLFQVVKLRWVSQLFGSEPVNNDVRNGVVFTPDHRHWRTTEITERADPAVVELFPLQQITDDIAHYQGAIVREDLRDLGIQICIELVFSTLHLAAIGRANVLFPVRRRSSFGQASIRDWAGGEGLISPVKHKKTAW